MISARNNLFILLLFPFAAAVAGVSVGSAQTPAEPAASAAKTQAVTTPAATPIPAKQTISKYLLGPDDQISIRVRDVEDLDGKEVHVDARGFVDVPIAGRLQAAGLTVEQFEAELTNKLRAFVRDPRVTVTLVEVRSRTISVLGEVNTPGVLRLDGQKTLSDVLSEAGGLRTDAGNVIKITRQKSWGEIPLPSAHAEGSFNVASVSVRELLEAKDPRVNILVEPSDVISVPPGDLVYVVGAVQKAGGFVLGDRDSMTVLQALSMAEGLDKVAATKRAKIIRSENGASAKVELPVNIKSILEGKSSDVALLPNDILFIPTSGGKVAANRTLDAVIQAATGVAIYRR